MTNVFIRRGNLDTGTEGRCYETPEKEVGPSYEKEPQTKLTLLTP